MGLKLYCWIGVGLYAILSIADLILTFNLLRVNRAAYESNPIAARCLEQFGWGGLTAYKAGAVLIFISATALIARRRPTVGAGVVTFGCAVLFSVTTYSQNLIEDAHGKIAERKSAIWHHRQPPRFVH
jgi:hypothetical protein